MKKLLLFFLIITSTLLPQKKQLTLEDIFLNKKYAAAKIENIQWLPNGTAFTFTKVDSGNNLLNIFKYEVETGKTSLLLSGSDLLYNDVPVRMSSYKWTDDGKRLLIEGPEKEIWRHSRQAPFYLYQVERKKISALGNNSPNLRNVKLSPDGKMAAFVRNHNIYLADLETVEEKKLTFDGNENILNGEFDWVYEEEFEIADGFQFSPDGSKIAFWRFDQSRVKEFYLVDELPVYNKISPLKYPKTGEKNSIVKIGVLDLQSGSTIWIDTGTEDDIYLPRIYWTNSSDKLAVLRLNRQQNFLEVLMCNTGTGESAAILTETDTCWVDVDKKKAVFLKNSNKFIWVSEISGYRHAYLYDYNGNLLNQITKGRWEITSIIGVSEEDSRLYFYGKKDSHLEQHIYRVKLNGDSLQNISQKPGWHIANFAPNYKCFIDEYSSVENPENFYLKNSDGPLVSTLIENYPPALKNINMVYPEFSSFKTSDGFELFYYMIKPYNFDANKKYPVIVYGYGGPGSQKVINRWDDTRRLWHQLMTEKGYIIFCVDNRGTGGQGKALKNLMYKDLSYWSVNDHIEAAEFLQSLSYVDENRIGFWGWSGGGYLCLMLMTRAADYFSTGISIAPVSDFRYYDAIWTERYMGMSSENEEAYDKSSVITYADGLKGNLLIIHGTADDNVHHQNTLRIVKEFQLKGKMFDMMLYPGKNHSIKGGNTRYHLFKKLTDYFMDKL